MNVNRRNDWSGLQNGQASKRYFCTHQSSLLSGIRSMTVQSRHHELRDGALRRQQSWADKGWAGAFNAATDAGSSCSHHVQITSTGCFCGVPSTDAWHVTVRYYRVSRLMATRRECVLVLFVIQARTRNMEHSYDTCHAKFVICRKPHQ